jgi:hypothetical protein
MNRAEAKHLPARSDDNLRVLRAFDESADAGLDARARGRRARLLPFAMGKGRRWRVRRSRSSRPHEHEDNVTARSIAVKSPLECI